MVCDQNAQTQMPTIRFDWSVKVSEYRGVLHLPGVISEQYEMPTFSTRTIPNYMVDFPKACSRYNRLFLIRRETRHAQFASSKRLILNKETWRSIPSRDRSY